MKKIAIITGASSGMGKVFAETINTYDTFDEVWVAASTGSRACRRRSPSPCVRSRWI